MYEENELEYRPKLDLPERIKSGFVTDSDDGDSGENEIVKVPIPEKEIEIGDGLVTDSIIEFEIIKDKFENLLEKTRNELKDTYVEVPFDLIDELNDAKDLIGLPPGENISVNDYEQALNNLDNPGGAYIVELWEDFQEDVNGSIKAELFGDIVELNKETKHTEDFLQSFIGKLLLEENIDFTKENWNENVLKKEKEHKEKREKIIEYKNEAEQEQLNAFLFDAERIVEGRQGVYNITKFEKESNQIQNDLTESVETLNTKTSFLTNIYSNIENNLERESFTSSENILKPMIEISDDESDFKNSLTKMNAMLKLSVDKQNKEKHNVKNNLRNLYSVNKREKLMDELLVDSEVYRKISLGLTHSLNYFDDSMGNEMDVLLNSLAMGLQETLNEKNNKTLAYYSDTMGESKLRKLKIENALEKDTGRQGFQFLTQVLNKTEDKGRPTVNNVDTFLD